MLQADHDLKAALVKWRRETAIQKLGTAIVRNYGAKVFISDQIIERLVVCAHAHKLAGVDDISRETGWRKDQAETHGGALLKIIHSHTPLPVLPPAASSTGGANGASHGAQVVPDAGSMTRKRRPAKCSKCHQEGHISAYHYSLLAACMYLPFVPKVQISHVLQGLQVEHMMNLYACPLPMRTQCHMAAVFLQGLLHRHDPNPGHIIVVHKRSRPHFQTMSQVLQVSYRLHAATITSSLTLLRRQVRRTPPTPRSINRCTRHQDRRHLLLLHPLMCPSLHHLLNCQSSFSPS